MARKPHQHKYQVVSYASLLSPCPDELRVVYIDRETLNVARECPVNYKLLIKEVEDDWRMLIDAWTAQQEPQANPDDSWECKFCAYRNACPHCGD